MRYAVKIGEIYLQSEKPISMDERERAVKELTRAYRGVLLITQDGVEIRAATEGDA